MDKKNIILEKSYQLALNVLELIKNLPRNTQGFIVGNQLGKAGTSVGANVEEAVGAFSKDDFAFKTLVTSKIYKRPNLITLFDENNKVIRLKLVPECFCRVLCGLSLCY